MCTHVLYIQNVLSVDGSHSHQHFWFGLKASHVIQIHHSLPMTLHLKPTLPLMIQCGADLMMCVCFIPLVILQLDA